METWSVPYRKLLNKFFSSFHFFLRSSSLVQYYEKKTSYLSYLSGLLKNITTQWNPLPGCQHWPDIFQIIIKFHYYSIKMCFLRLFLDQWKFSTYFNAYFQPRFVHPSFCVCIFLLEWILPTPMKYSCCSFFS